MDSDPKAASENTQETAKNNKKRNLANSKQPSLDSGSTNNSRSSSIDRASPSLRTSVEEQRKGREEKNMEELLKSLATIPEPEVRCTTLVTKYATLHEENRVMAKTLKQTQSMYSGIVREKDKIDESLKKASLSKIKLEDLCRELQKQNKMIKKEGLEQLKDQESKRKELSDKFKTALSDIHEAMNQGKERSDRLTDENAALAVKLKALIEQYDAKDDHTKKIIQTRDLQCELYETKLKQAGLRTEKVVQESLQEKHMLLSQLKERDEELREVLKQDRDLKEQLATYASKYTEFQDNLQESNSTFTKFKEEMDKMNSGMIKVQAESRKWKQKAEDSNKALVDMAQSKMQMEQKVAQQVKITQKLEALTRALQKERSDLLKLVPKGAALPESLPVGEEKSDVCPCSSANNTNSTAEVAAQ